MTEGSAGTLSLIVRPGASPTEMPWIVRANAAACQALGYAADDLAGHSFTLLAGDRTDQNLLQKMRDSVDARIPQNGGFVVYHRAGHPMWAEWSLQPLPNEDVPGTSELTARIVERRRAADGDMRSLIAAIEHATDAIIVYELHGEDDLPRVQYANRAAELQSGYTRHELEHASRYGAQTDMDSVRAIVQTMREGDAVRSRLRLYRKDGSAYWAELNVRPLVESTPGMWRWISIERDVSEEVEREGLMAAEIDAYATLAAAAEVFLDTHDRTRMADTRSHARQRLVAAARPEAARILDSMYESAMRRITLFEESENRRDESAKVKAAQTDVMSMLAHDIRGPLNTIVGFAELIGEMVPDEPDVQEYAQLITRAANRIVELTNEVIVAAQLDRNEYSPAVEHFELLSLIGSVVSLLPGGDRASFAFSDPELEIEADMAGVRHIVSNLASNALKYSDPSTTVDIIATREGDEVHMTFRDHGIGIPKADLARVFERFSRASNAKSSKIRGTGLGLYFVRQLVERSNGSITIDSTVNVGTTVEVRIPLRPIGRDHRPLILSVEDTDDAKSVIAAELRNRGYFVRVVDSLEAADAMVRREPVALVIADLDGQDRDEVATLSATCEEKGLRMLTLSHEVGAPRASHLRKPVVGADLAAAVAALVPTP